MQTVRRLDWGQIIYLGVSLASSIYLMKWAINQLDPNRPAMEAARRRQKDLERQIGRPLLRLQGLEASIASEVVNPDNIDITLEDVGGLDTIVKSLVDNIILPLRRPELFRSHLLHQPKGVLLYGPPGTGKTMLAKALAKESGAIFINIRASAVQSKWLGDSQKLVTAIFSLARKLEPSIIFIDEVDGLLGRRREQDHEATTSLKTEFMQLWDGFLSERQANVLVLGATNRVGDLDEAVLRRFNLKFPVLLPNEKQRESILRVTLQRHAQENFIDNALLHDEPLESGERPLQVLARQTPGYSGSDLFELCAQAAVISVHEFVKASDEQEQHLNGAEAVHTPSPAAEGPRPMAFRDLQAALDAQQPHRAAAAVQAQDTGLDSLRQLMELKQMAHAWQSLQNMFPQPAARPHAEDAAVQPHASAQNENGP